MSDVIHVGRRVSTPCRMEDVIIVGERRSSTRNSSQLYNTNKLKDTKGIHDVVVLLSKDDRPLSEAQVKSWVDNYKASLNRKNQSEKDTDPKDKDQE